MGWMDFLKSAANSGNNIAHNFGGKPKPSPLPSGTVNNYANMFHGLVQGNAMNGSNTAKGKTNQHPQANGGVSAGQPINAAPDMPTPGANGYTPTTAPYGMDQTNPGVQEQFWNQNQNLWTKGAFQGPGKGEQFWNQVAGSFNTSGNNGNLQPQFDAAYDRAKEKAVGTANQQAAARGVYGSSAALNNVGNVAADIEAARAKEATNFALANSANQRSQLGTYGNLAFQAGNEGLANRGFDLNALNSAFGASGSAQGQRDNRIQRGFNNQMAMTGQYLPFLQQNYDAMQANDMGLVTGNQEANVARTAAGIANQQANRQQFNQDLNTGLGMYGAFAGGGGAPSPGQPAPNPGYSPNYGGYGRVY